MSTYLNYLLVQHLTKYLFKGNLPQALFKHPYKKLPLQRSRRIRRPSSPNPLYCRPITYILASNSLVYYKNNDYESYTYN